MERIVHDLAKPRKLYSAYKEGTISEQLAGQYLGAKGLQKGV